MAMLPIHMLNSAVFRRLARALLLILAAALILAACTPQQTTEAPTPEQAPQATPAQTPNVAISPPTQITAPTAIGVGIPAETPNFASAKTLARGYLTTPNELRRIAAMAQAGVEPYRTAVAAELQYAADALAEKDLNIPEKINIRGDDIDKPRFLSVGAKQVYAWALAYNLLRDSDAKQAEQYAEQAYAMVMAMPRKNTRVSGYQENTRLNLAVYMQNFVYAADLLADWAPKNGGIPFGASEDAQLLKQWLSAEIIRYPYNAAYTRVNNWGAWGRLTTAVIADYVGDAAPLYVQQMTLDEQGAYQVDPAVPCDAGNTDTCTQVEAGALYADMIQLHLDMVDGKLTELSVNSCDGSGSKSMIRPDGGIPDELRRQYDCDATSIPDAYGSAARYSQFAVEAMISLAELAWRRGDDRLYTHIDAATGRGALYRSLQFLINNNVRLTRGSMLEMANRFYSYQINVERDEAKRQEYQKLLSHDLPGILKREGGWPEGAAFVSFGTLTHGFAPNEALNPPPVISPR